MDTLNTPTHILTRSLTLSPTQKALPPSVDEPIVLSRADILQNKSFVAAGHVNVGQVGFAHIQPVRCVLTSGKLENVRYQCCHTQAEDMDTFENDTII